MGNNTVTVISERGVLEEPDGAADIRRRGVGSYQAAVADAAGALSEALSWANELTAIPHDQRREVAELANRVKVLSGEVERLR